MHMIHTGTDDSLIFLLIPGPDATGTISFSMLFRIPG